MFPVGTVVLRHRSSALRAVTQRLPTTPSASRCSSFWRILGAFLQPDAASRRLRLRHSPHCLSWCRLRDAGAVSVPSSHLIARSGRVSTVRMFWERGRIHVAFVIVHCYNCSILFVIICYLLSVITVLILLGLIDKLNSILCMYRTKHSIYRVGHSPWFQAPLRGGGSWHVCATSKEDYCISVWFDSGLREKAFLFRDVEISWCCFIAGFRLTQSTQSPKCSSRGPPCPSPMAGESRLFSEHPPSVPSLSPGCGLPQSLSWDVEKEKKKKKTWELTCTSSLKIWVPYPAPLLFIHCSRWTNAPLPHVHVQRPGTCEYVTSRGKKDFANSIKWMILWWERLSWIIWVGLMWSPGPL